MWVSEPWHDEAGRWTSETISRGFRKIGKGILSHPEIERLDNEVMLHYMPGMDLANERWIRFGLVRSAHQRGSIVGGDSFKTALDVTPYEWFEWACDVGREHAFEAQFAQKLLDPEIPF